MKLGLPDCCPYLCPTHSHLSVTPYCINCRTTGFENGLNNQKWMMLGYLATARKLNLTYVIGNWKVGSQPTICQSQIAAQHDCTYLMLCMRSESSQSVVGAA
jgi:hypothetical protein